MSILSTKADGFLNSICDLHSIEKTAFSAFSGGNKGELFVEYKEEETLRIENSVVQAPNFVFRRGFGLRSFKDTVSRYSHSSSLDGKSVKKALEAIRSENSDCRTEIKENAHDLYDHGRFLNSFSSEDKIKLLQKIDEYARSKSENIRQVTAALAASWQVISIFTDEGKRIFDIRPLVRLSVQTVIEKNGILESGAYSGGGRFGYDLLFEEETRVKYVDEALRQAEIKLQAVKAPVGEMPVVLGNGWTGILLHEAIGHGLEGDAVRKKTSSFHNLLGEMIAAPHITVVDDGTLPNRRGSLNTDDEGTDSQRTVLIENGKLVGFMQDRMNADLMGVGVTGNGRRESYKVMPIPRMTNTFMIAGDHSQEEMIARVKNGIFAKSFSDGQVDVASGKFVFSASEAYLIEDGKITVPVKGAMLIGDGPSILKRISMVGSDFSLDNGVGTCGKDGQWVPVGVGEPSILIDTITVGGANL
jgi:TldD protein